MGDLIPPRNGEGDHPKDGGGVARHPLPTPLAGSARPLHHSLRERSPSPFRGGIVVAALVLLADQLSKYWITGPLALPYREPIELLPIFRLIWVENHGVSMGFLTASSAGQRWLLVATTSAIAAFIAVWLTRERKLPEALALGAILGGAIGNIVDRARLGYVADFLNLHFGAWSPFYVFNVADAAISLGVALLLIRSLFTGRERPAVGE